MKLAIEMFSIVIVVTIACIVFSSYISTENQNVKARDFYNVAVNRIEIAMHKLSNNVKKKPVKKDICWLQKIIHYQKMN